jgi:hypothetical protein
MQIVYSLILFFLFFGINIGLAKYDAYKIKRNLRIRHAINSIIYIACIAIFYKWLTVYKVVGLLLIRIPVFNTALNLFRGHVANHISHTTTSIIDQRTNKVVMKIGYFTYHGILLILSLIFVLL